MVQQVDAAWEDHRAVGAAGVRLAAVAGQGVQGGVPDRGGRVVEHGDQVVQDLRYEQVVQQVAALFAYAGLGVAQAPADRGDGGGAVAHQFAEGLGAAGLAAQGVDQGVRLYVGQRVRSYVCRGFFPHDFLYVVPYVRPCPRFLG
ncbi:hypothetical protein GCM10010307_05290 [Streptomyces vastus]|uniref:Uncharacterized protein n=1 Tax=Streptomyces vastus TaxID=285451 RepID=A0ABP6CL67_9ACTN